MTLLANVHESDSKRKEYTRAAKNIRKKEDEKMSLSRRYLTEIPDETKEIAQTAFPKGNVYLTMRDELGVMYEDSEFAQDCRRDC
jgi:hypothetical protein